MKVRCSSHHTSTQLPLIWIILGRVSPFRWTDDGDEMITLISKEQNRHQVSKKAASISSLIKAALSGDDSGEEVWPFYLVLESLVLALTQNRA